MSIYRVSETCVFADNFLYHFDTPEEASCFDDCVENHPFAFCKTRFRPAKFHRAPVKIQTRIDFLRTAKEKRHQSIFERQKKNRQALLRKKRGLPPPGAPSLQPAPEDVVRPYQGKHVSYVVHGHAGYLEGLGLRHYPKTRLKFYCAKGETTQDTERRNSNNAPSKLIKALLRSKADDNRVHETIEPGTACECLLVQADPDPQALPKQGIWFVARDHAGSVPYECKKIVDLPKKLSLFLPILNKTILADAHARKLPAPFDIFWVACRARLVAG